MPPSYRAFGRGDLRAPFARARCGRALIGLVATFGLLLTGVGCASAPKPRKSCLVIDASEELNYYDGVPHPVTVYVYALSASDAFEQVPPDDLLAGSKPVGVLQPPVPITVQPGEKVSLQELFPAQTRQLGVLADFYRAPGDPAGTLTQVVPARCGLRRPKIELSRSDIEPNS